MKGNGAWSYAEVLFHKAVSDFVASKRLWETRDSDIDNPTIMFHLQQSVEKLLKSSLSSKGVHFEKGYDIVMNRC